MAVSETGGFSPGGIIVGAGRGIIGGRDVKIRPVPPERLEYDAARANAIARATEAAIQRGELPRPPSDSLPGLRGFDLWAYSQQVRDLVARDVNPEFPDVSRTFDDVPQSFADLPAAERARLAGRGGGVWEPPPLFGRVSFDPFVLAAAAPRPRPAPRPRRPPRRRTKPPERPQPRRPRPDRRLPPRIRPPPLPPRPDIPGPVRELPGLFRFLRGLAGPLAAFWALVTNPPPRRFSDGGPRPPQPPESPPERAPRPRVPPAQPDQEPPRRRFQPWERPKGVEWAEVEMPPGPAVAPPPAPAPIQRPAPAASPGPAPRPAPPAPRPSVPSPSPVARGFPFARLLVPSLAAALVQESSSPRAGQRPAARPQPPQPQALTGPQRGALQSESPLESQCRELARQRRREREKKRKRKRQRTECFVGTYREYFDGTKKRRKKRVPCRQLQATNRKAKP